MFIQLNGNNEIIASANFKFAEDCIKTDKEVIRNWDGRLVFKGEETKKPEPTLEELKQEKIRELKANCSNYIYSKYPIHKQLNATNGLATEEEISEMSSFIQKARLICGEKEQQINSVKTQKELEKISTNFNQE